MTKEQPDIRIDRLGTHLFNVTRKDGSSFLKWHWESLEAEVKVAIANYESKKVHKTSKIDLVKETEAKVTKTRAKKATTKKKETK